MALKSPPLKERPSVICDWVELKALSSSSGEFRLNSLRRLWDVNRESEDSDPEGNSTQEMDTAQSGVSGEDDEAFISSIIKQFDERTSALGPAYPFELESGSRIRVVGPPGEGGYMYLFCLFLSYANGHELLDGTWFPQVDNSVRDLFQACATVAAAADVDGCAISFGWPRPYENPPFLVKLKTVYTMFGEGAVVNTPRPGVSPSPKDEEIDIIAWKPSRDKAAGKTYLLGQVASGDNWDAKAIHGAPINSFHSNWFDNPPRSIPIGSIFIPSEIQAPNRSDTRHDRMEVITARYGKVFDRLRLPLLTQEGIDLARTRSDLTIERHEEFPNVGEWVVRQILELQQSST